MDLSTGIYYRILIVLALCSSISSSQLYLQPTKSDHGYFTGDNFFITCFTTDENINKLAWTDFEGNPIDATEGRVHIQPAEGMQHGLRLVFTNVEKEDGGPYTCSDDHDSVNFELIVYRSISYSDTPKVQHAPEGDTGLVICNVKSDPKPVVNWYFNGSKLTNNHKYKILENHSLMIHNLSRSDAGDYKCKSFVITPLGSQVKDLDITLHVQYSPEIIGDQRIVSYATIGLQTNLTCTVTADPVPIFQWLRDEMEVHNGTKSFLIFNTDNTSVLQMTVDSEDQLGEYICHASNALGKKEVIVELKEGETPPAPKLSVTGEDQGIVKLKIEIKDDHKDDELRVLGFKVEYILASETWDMSNSQEFDYGENYILRNMSFNSDYILRATAHNAAGYGQPSEAVPYKTHSLQVASVVASASGMVVSSLVLLISIVFFRLF